MSEPKRVPTAQDEKISSSGVAAVLNGGSEVMESGTIPIQWFFSENIAAMGPKYVFIVEQDASESKDEIREEDRGRRYLRKVSDGVAFIQFLRPGHHRIMVLVLHPEVSKEDRLGLIAHEENGRFKESISWSEQSGGYPFVGGRIIECTVPEEVFATRPETWWSKLVWKWANYLYPHEPVDQCAYRSRKIHAFTWKPFAVAGLFAGKGVVWAAKLVLGLLFAVVMLLIDAVILFAGFRPAPVWQNVKYALRLRTSMMSNNLTMRWGYRVWLYGNGEVPLMRVPPAEIVGFGIALFLIGIGIRALLNELLWTAAVIVIVAGFGILLMLSYATLTRIPSLAAYALSRKQDRAARIREREAKEKAEEERLAAEMRERHFRWLRENFGTDRIPERVDLDLIPRPETRRERAIQHLRVSYWSTKIRVCKPFAQ